MEREDALALPYADGTCDIALCTLALHHFALGGVPLDLSKVTTPIFVQASREDHIAPYRSVYKGSKLFGGPVNVSESAEVAQYQKVYERLADLALSGADAVAFLRQVMAEMR